MPPQKDTTTSPGPDIGNLATKQIRDIYEVKMFGSEADAAKLKEDETKAKVDAEINRRFYHGAEAAKPLLRRLLNVVLDSNAGAVLEGACLAGVTIVGVYYGQKGVRNWWSSDDSDDSLSE